ncbi:MAG TPA: mechanosensitive ion channel family protein [Acidimicrobiales bacterium]|jgi:small conductance mechanosensitive channel|nr:mechanosensitive ion channel family protein [Acidimicrobiales bacterium]
MVAMRLVDGVDDAAEIKDSASSAWATAVEALPRVGIAVVVLVVFVVVGRVLRPIVRGRLARTRTPSFARVFAKLTSAVMTLSGALLAMAVVFPSIKPVNLLAGAGVLSIAVGFAFQDILQNLLAGILLLFRHPFSGGDQIEVEDVTGTVEEITIRETVVMTYDGRRVLVPNATVYTNVIRVQTARPRIRAGFVVGVAYETDLADARHVARDAVAAVEGVADDPPVEVFVTELGDWAINLEVLFWCDARQLEMRRTKSDAIEAVKMAFDAHGIEIPCQVVALQATSSFEAALQGKPVTPAGAVRAG